MKQNETETAVDATPETLENAALNEASGGQENATTVGEGEGTQDAPESEAPPAAAE